MFFKLFQLIKDYKKQIFTVIVITIFLIVSLWRLSDSPATWFDEGINIGIAKSLVEHGVYSLEIGPGEFVDTRPFLITTNYPVLIPVAFFLKFFGTSLLSVRISMVLFLWTFVILAYFFVKRKYRSSSFALLTVALITTFAPFYGNGKVVLGEVPGLVFLLGALLLLPEMHKPLRLYLAGLLFGLAIVTKPFFLIVIIAVALGEFYRAYSIKNFSSFIQRILLIVVGAILPIGIWLFTIISPFSITTIIKTIHYYSNSYAASNFVFLVGNNLKRFVTESTPIHFMVLLIPSCIFLYRRHRKKKLEESEIILITFIFINILWYLKTPGWYRYFVTAHMVTFLFFPVAFFSLMSRRVAMILVGGLLLFQGLHLFTRHNDPLYFSDSARIFATEVDSTLSTSDSVLVINTPSIAFLLTNPQIFQYLQINPTLSFGHARLQDEQGNWYSDIIIVGSSDNVQIPEASTILEKEYQLEKTVGKYQLYRKK